MPTVDLVVNCYERTYRDVLKSGFFYAIEQQNLRPFAGRYAVINNVDRPEDAQQRAQGMVNSGELTGYRFVDDEIGRALRVAGLKRRSLGGRPYLLDYGLVMAVTGSSDWLVVWDAELWLEEPANWIDPGLELLAQRDDVFVAAPAWPRIRNGLDHDTLDRESVKRDGPWRLNWGASDQCLLVRRSEIAGPMWQHYVVPASLARHASHPFSFEARMEHYQRSAGRYRASHEAIRYVTRDFTTSVIDRGDGRGNLENLRARALTRLGRSLSGRSTHPRLHLP